MPTVRDIAADLTAEKIKFHKREESDLYRDALQAYLNHRYSTAANLCATLYEKIFTTRLVNETANPSGFIPSKDNIHEQLANLLNREVEIIENKKFTFRKITDELVRVGVLSVSEKTDYDNFYTNVRNPVAHGLTIRLFERAIGRRPANTFDIDANYEAVFKYTSKKLIQKIYKLMMEKILRKL